ncbi:MAG TPA: hypothetical protein DCQ37_08680 [Desulfobacteraceae bacterium]|nr:hypothetical protein [Desulfobacteraceae bacterium]
MSNKAHKGHVQENFQHLPIFKRKMPVVYGVVFNPLTNEKSDLSEKFLVDTGSEINILRGYYEDLFKNNPIIGSQPISYGGSTQALSYPVYKVEIKIKGDSFNIEAVIDKNIRYSVIGQAFFKKQLNILSFRDIGQNQWITNFRFFKGGKKP